MKEVKPLLSIITIVYNGIHEIKKTIESVSNQDYKDFEFIVIEGDSNDGTQEIIEGYKDKIDCYISEKDEGIYDAMNKGIKEAKGTWVNFMNAGDTFYSNTVLTQVFSKYTDYQNKTMIYGYNYTDAIKNLPHRLEVLEMGIIMANHQSMFFNKELLGEELIYSLDYPIYGDYELVNRIYLKFGKKTFKYIEKPVAIYEGGGVSSFVSLQKRRDKYKILLKAYGLFSVLKGLFFRLKKGSEIF